MSGLVNGDAGWFASLERKLTLRKYTVTQVEIYKILARNSYLLSHVFEIFNDFNSHPNSYLFFQLFSKRVFATP